MLLISQECYLYNSIQASLRLCNLFRNEWLDKQEGKTAERKTAKFSPKVERHRESKKLFFPPSGHLPTTIKCAKSLDINELNSAFRVALSFNRLNCCCRSPSSPPSYIVKGQRAMKVETTEGLQAIINFALCNIPWCNWHFCYNL